MENFAEAGELPILARGRIIQNSMSVLAPFRGPSDEQVNSDPPGKSMDYQNCIAIPRTVSYVGQLILCLNVRGFVTFEMSNRFC